MLNLSNNKLTKITSNIASLVNLRALVLNNNQLTEVTNIESLILLTTLVISHNKISTIDLSALTELSKLSATHNLFTQIPNLTGNQLKEIRLAHNKITTLDRIDTFLSKTVEIIDLGNNSITIKKDEQFESLKLLPGIVHLNLKGNDIQMTNHKRILVDLLENLRVLDGERFDLRFKERKVKRKVMDIKKSKREERIAYQNNKKEGKESDKLKKTFIQKESIKFEVQKFKHIKEIVEKESTLPKTQSKKRDNPFEQVQLQKKQKNESETENQDTNVLNLISLSGVVGVVEGKLNKDRIVSIEQHKSVAELSAWD